MTPWTVAPQAPPSMGFTRQNYWSRLPFPSPADLPDPQNKLRSPVLQALFTIWVTSYLHRRKENAGDFLLWGVTSDLRVKWDTLAENDFLHIPIKECKGTFCNLDSILRGCSYCRDYFGLRERKRCVILAWLGIPRSVLVTLLVAQHSARNCNSSVRSHLELVLYLERKP